MDEKRKKLGEEHADIWSLKFLCDTIGVDGTATLLFEFARGVVRNNFS
jgi:hypothetical protein